jgi:N-acetylmuramoyl-L-alanine amidase/type II secretory pathway predicted ATPase ExeA
MLLDFFHLREQPFGVTPDPAYLFPSRTHCEALDALTDGILDGRGFLALIAEPGMGKTTLLNQVLDGLRGTASAAYLFQTQCNSREFFQYLLSELGVDSTGMGLVAMHNKLNEFLFSELLAGKRFVLIVDEAQNLDTSVLETIRLLSNFETTNTKLLQIILAGQPELGEKLAERGLEQLLQRITVVKHLEALSTEETGGYIKHRLKVAGHNGTTLFEPQAVALIAELSQGIPRIVNRICFQALQEAYAGGCSTVSSALVVKANLKLGVFKADHKLRIVVPAKPPSLPTGSASLETVVVPAAVPLTYKPSRKFDSRNWSLLGAALIVVLLSATVALSRNRMTEMMQSIRSEVTADLSSLRSRNPGAAIRGAGDRIAEFSNGLVHREETGQHSKTLEVRESGQSIDSVPPGATQRGITNITSIQASTADGEARVVVVLNDVLQYHSARIASPDRIYFDLYKTQLSSAVAQKTVPTEDGLLKWVRTAQNTDDTVRLVLDADGARDYSAQLLSNPYRLVIDVYSQSNHDPKHEISTDGGDEITTLRPETSAPQQRTSLTRELGLKMNRIAIDPGHGGYDTGTMGPRGLLEKNLCLDVALRLGQLIEKNMPGAEVVYTRKDDRHIPLEERAAIANAANADLFISIHANSSDLREARGVETYYLNLAASPESTELIKRENALAQASVHDLPELIKKITRNERMAESKQLAVNIQSALSQGLQLVNSHEANRGVKQAPFVVLTGANMPAVLSEISFVSNPSDESLLLESGQRQRVAEGLYRGIAAYFDSFYKPLKKDYLSSESRLNVPGVTTAAIGGTHR